jgi:hypothetical protein
MLVPFSFDITVTILYCLHLDEEMLSQQNSRPIVTFDKQMQKQILPDEWALNKFSKGEG